MYASSHVTFLKYQGQQEFRISANLSIPKQCERTNIKPPLATTKLSACLKIALKTQRYQQYWLGWLDSNQRPPAPQVEAFARLRSLCASRLM